MGGKIKLSDLPPELQKKLRPDVGRVKDKTIALGKVLQTFDGMTRRDALWVLKKARAELIAK